GVAQEQDGIDKSRKEALVACLVQLAALVLQADGAGQPDVADAVAPVRQRLDGDVALCQGGEEELTGPLGNGHAGTPGRWGKAGQAPGPVPCTRGGGGRPARTHLYLSSSLPGVPGVGHVRRIRGQLLVEGDVGSLLAGRGRG